MLRLATIEQEGVGLPVRSGYRDPDTIAYFFSLDAIPDGADLSACPARAFPGGRRRRRRAKFRIADAMIEPDPIDALAFARRVPVAEMDAPVRRV